MGTVGGAIVRLRLARGMRPADLARAAGLPRQTISSIETGKVRSPGSETLRPIARALGVPIEEITDAAEHLPSVTGPDDDDEVLLAEAELGRLVRDARADFPDDEDYRLFRDSVIRNARAMREIARRKGRDRGDGG